MLGPKSRNETLRRSKRRTRKIKNTEMRTLQKQLKRLRLK